MRLVLECHTLIECFDEWSSYRILANRLEPSGRAQLSGLKVPQLTEQLAQPMLRDDAAIRAGASGIPNSYHGETLIFMIRDARDAVASMLNLASWLPKFGDPVLEAKISGDPGFAERYSEEIRSAKISDHPQVARAALIWRYKVDALADYTLKGYPVLPVRYESLVTQPKYELSTICEFISVGYEDTLLSHPSMPHRDLRPDGLAMGKTDPNRPIDDKAVGQWRDVFSAPQLEELLRIAGPPQEMLYSDSAP